MTPELADREMPGRRRRARNSYRGRQASGAAFKYLVLMVLVVLFAGPFAWLVITALKAESSLAEVPVQFLPSPAQWNNFVKAVTQVDFAVYAFNSLLLSTVYAVLITLSSATVGFGFARLRGPGKRFLFLVMLSTMMIPTIVLLFPTYVMFARVGLINTYWPWVLWGLAGSPYLAFLFRQFFAAIPAALEEAAILDGCGYLRIFVRIFLPLSIPVLVTAFLLSFTWVWGDYITPSLLLNLNNTTLAVAISVLYVNPQNINVATLQAAGAILYMIPEMVIFFVAQRYFVRSIVTSGLKL